MTTRRTYHFGHSQQPATSRTHKQKLTTVDVEHVRMWRKMGFRFKAIARAYDISEGYASQLCSENVRVKR